MEILSIHDFPRQYWAVGSSFGGVRDQTSQFLNDEVWVEGCALSGNNRYKMTLDQIRLGDILAMKSCSNKGVNRSIAFTRLKAVGIVLGRKNYFTFTVNWLPLSKTDLP